MARASIACGALVLAAAACTAERASVQATYARFLTPAPLGASGNGAASVTRVMKVRAYTTPEYEAHAPDWRERIVAQVERANAVLASEFGVQLELESIISMPRRRHERPLTPTGALRVIAHDRSPEVDLFVAFVGPAAADAEPSRDYDMLGIAELYGRHLAVRAMQTQADVGRIDLAYDALSQEERAALARGHRVHREATVLLHEWGHALGAVHECDHKWIMARGYSLLHAAFSPESARLIRAGLEHHGARSREAVEAWARPWRAEAAAMQGSAWECGRLEEGLARADAAFTRWLEELARAGPPDPRREAADLYRDALFRAVSFRWDVAEEVLPPDDREVALQVELRVDRSGTVMGLRVLASSGIPGVDTSALKAVRSAEPLPPPPAEILDAGGEVVAVFHMMWRPGPAPAAGASGSPPSR